MANGDDTTNNSNNEQSTTDSQNKINTGDQKLDKSLMSMNNLIVNNCNEIIKKIDSKLGSPTKNQQDQIKQLTTALMKQIEINNQTKGIRVLVQNYFGNNEYPGASSKPRIIKAIGPDQTTSPISTQQKKSQQQTLPGVVKKSQQGNSTLDYILGLTGLGGVLAADRLVTGGGLTRFVGNMIGKGIDAFAIKPTKRLLEKIKRYPMQKIEEGASKLYNLKDMMIEVANEVNTLINQTIPMTLEKFKEEYSVGDKSVLGQAFKNVGTLGERIYTQFQDMKGEYFQLYETVENFMEALNKNITSLGSLGEIYGRSLSDNEKLANHFERARRALALSDDDINNLAKISITRNESIFESFSRIQNASDQAAQKFNLNQKSLVKDVNSLRKDFVNFGHMSEKELFNLVGRFKQLGVAVSDLDKLMGFDTFESAVESASQLHQAFGMNIDALKLIKAENPGEIADIFVNAFKDTGTTYDQLNFRQKRFLSQQTRMSDDMLRLMMNNRLSFEDAQKEFGNIDPQSDSKLQDQINQFKALDHSIPKTKKIKTFADDTAALTAGLKDAMRNSIGLKNSFVNLSTAFSNIHTKFTSDGEFRQKLEKSFSDLRNYIDRITKSVVTPNFEKIMDQLPAVISGFGLRMSPELTKDQRNKVKNSLDDQLEIIAQNMNKHFAKTKSLIIDTMLEGGGIAIRSFLPFMQSVVDDVKKTMDSMKDPGSDFINIRKLFKKFNFKKNRKIEDKIIKLANKGTSVIIDIGVNAFNLLLQGAIQGIGKGVPLALRMSYKIFMSSLKSIGSLLNPFGGSGNNKQKQQTLSNYQKSQLDALNRLAKTYQNQSDMTLRASQMRTKEGSKSHQFFQMLRDYTSTKNRQFDASDFFNMKKEAKAKALFKFLDNLSEYELKNLIPHHKFNKMNIHGRRHKRYMQNVLYDSDFNYNQQDEAFKYFKAMFDELNELRKENSNSKNGDVNVTIPVFIRDENGMLLLVGQERARFNANQQTTVIQTT
jgi:hypothetical protein